MTLVDLPDNVENDAALAQFLQEQYEEEYRRAQEQRSTPDPTALIPTAPPPPVDDYAGGLRAPSTSAVFRGDVATESDVELALRLDQEMRKEDARRMSHAHDGETPVTSRSSSLTDEELAVRVEQELHDEEFARRLSNFEHRRVQEIQDRESAAAAAAVAARPSLCRRCVGILLPLGIIAIAAAGLVFYFTDFSGDLPTFIPDPEAWAEEDPFNQVGPEDANKWRSNGRGLSLVVLNALDTEWYDYFYKAVAQWDGGRPDSLALASRVVPPDSDCATIDGYLKMCNGNYGETNWRGINKVLLQNGYITASSGRMNEFYFRGEGSAQRQYTMCHEIGHGFGLPHTDENFFNKDQGNCMDYTNRPERNMQPDTVNFEFLAQLYGTFDGNVTVLSASGTGNRLLRSIPRLLKTREHHRHRSVPRSVLDLVDEVDSFVDTGAFRSMPGWKLLHRHHHAEAHEIELGDGYSLQVHMLLAEESF